MRISNIMLANRFGGIGQAYLDYNSCLLERGHAVQAVCHVDGGWHQETQLQGEKYDALEIVTLKQKGGIKALPSFFKMKCEVKRFKPDIIIIHNYARFVMASTRGIAPQISITHMYKCKHFNKLDAVIALTKELSDMCVATGIALDKIYRVPNMITGEISSSPIFTTEIPTIASIGRLDSVKGYSYLIEACALMKQRGFLFRCKLGGKGFEEAHLRKRVKDLDLQNCFEFSGFISDKKSFFEDVDIFALPSTSEPFGISLLEAMQYGKAIVASNIGGPSEILSHGENGLLVPPADPEALANALCEFIEDVEKGVQLAERAQKTLAEKYTSEQVGALLEMSLLQICAKS